MSTSRENEMLFDHRASDEIRAASKARWGPGPWQDEPDRVEWHHAGLPCLLLRGPMGQWNGYVGLPLEHPWYGTEGDAGVHGGITYADHSNEVIGWLGADGPGVSTWWIGFDCGHAGDFQPALHALMSSTSMYGGRGVYRTLAYAQHETEALARQVTDVMQATP